MSYFGIPIRNGLPIGLGSVAPLASGGGSPFSPLSLFSGGAPGAWYDPSDYTTLFQDSAGTTPVTAVEQPVGLMLDKSQGLVLGPELVTNGDFSNGTTGWTLGTGWSVSGGFAVSVGGANAALSQTGGSYVSGRTYRVTFDITVTSGYVLAYVANGGNVQISNSGAKALTLVASSSGGFTLFGFSFVGSVDNVSVKELPGNHAFQATSASRPVLSARYNLCVTSEFPSGTSDAQLSLGFVSSSLTGYQGALSCTNLSGPAYAYKTTGLPTSAGLFRMRAVVQMSDGLAPLLPSTDPSSALNDFMFVIGGGNAAATLGEEISPGVFEVFGVLQTSAGNNGRYGIQRISGSARRGFVVTAYDVRPDNQSSIPYQRVNTATDYATTGFLPYLKFDGVDDSLSTNSISFTSTDKMSVFAGVRKLSDGTFGIIAELSATIGSNNGSFVLLGPNGTLPDYGFISKGTIATEAVGNDYESPITNTLTGLGNISGDSTILRINGAQVAATTSDQGTGNYGNYPLFIGRRNNASLPFNGQLYGLIIVGKAVTAGELSSTETWVNGKTGAYA